MAIILNMSLVSFVSPLRVLCGDNDCTIGGFTKDTKGRHEGHGDNALLRFFIIADHGSDQRIPKLTRGHHPIL